MSFTLKKIRIFFNGENKTNESTFDTIDQAVQPGSPTVLSTAMQAIPFEAGKDDEIYLSFEEISSKGQLTQENPTEEKAAESVD